MTRFCIQTGDLLERVSDEKDVVSQGGSNSYTVPPGLATALKKALQAVSKADERGFKELIDHLACVAGCWSDTACSHQSAALGFLQSPSQDVNAQSQAGCWASCRHSEGTEVDWGLSV